MLKFKKLRPDAQLPVYATPGAACFDFFAYIISDEFGKEGGKVTLAGLHKSEIISTALSVEIPTNKVMLLFSRSGHGFKNNVRLSNCVGVIDSDYRGEIQCKLRIDESSVYSPGLTIKHGDRIMQGMIVDCPQQEIIEVEELSETERGEGGFGSTDAKVVAKAVVETLYKQPFATAVPKTLNEINDERFKRRIDSLSKDV